MYPLKAETRLKTFCLLRSTQTCCYGPRPQFNQYLLVECSQPVKFERLAPVVVRGIFHVDAQPDQGFIYRMDSAEVEHVAGEVPEIDAVAAAKKAGLSVFPFSLLTDMKKAGRPASIPLELAALDGKTFVVNGFCVGRTGGKIPGIIIGKDWWDGVSQGTPPTLFNAIMALPLNASQVPPLWQMRIVMSGVVKVEKDPAKWPAQGIICLQNAVIGVPEGQHRLVVDSGPFLPLSLEFLIICLFIVFTIDWEHFFPRGSKKQ